MRTFFRKNLTIFALFRWGNPQTPPQFRLNLLNNKIFKIDK